MITVFYRTGVEGRIAEQQLSPTENVPDDPIWIDLVTPSAEELRHLPQNLNIALPSREETWRNHALNRMQTRDGNSYMTAALLTAVDSQHPKTSPVTFILNPDFLITIREIDATSFLNFQEQFLLNPKRYPQSEDVLEALLDAVITRVAYNHARVIEGLDTLSETIFADHTFDKGNPSMVMRGVLKELGYLNDLNSKISECLYSIQRLLRYFKETHNRNSPEKNKDVERLIKDTHSLSEQSEFLSDKILFQLDTSLGMINVEQNLIAKIFSVVALIFLPPSLVVGYFGMNFDKLPMLSWPFGHEIAFVIMVLFAIAPYVFFKYKKWL